MCWVIFAIVFQCKCEGYGKKPTSRSNLQKYVLHAIAEINLEVMAALHTS